MAIYTQRYSGNVSRGGKSSVYEVKKLTGSKRLRIEFRDRQGKRATYYYKESVIGSTHYKNMWSLAKQGVGLNSYLHRYAIAGERV